MSQNILYLGLCDAVTVNVRLASVGVEIVSNLHSDPPSVRVTGDRCIP
jgi:hypothetical protein